MRQTARKGWVAVVGVTIAGALALTACSSGSGSAESSAAAPASSAAAPAEESMEPSMEASAEGDAAAASECATLTPVKLQLQWFAQAQFAGYYAAVDQGFYSKAGLDVSILEGGVDITPQKVLADGGADFAITQLFFDNEDDYRRGDETLNAMPASETPGQRTSVTR